MYLALSGSLLQPVTVYAMYLLTSLFAVVGGRPRSDPPPAGAVTTDDLVNTRAARIP